MAIIARIVGLSLLAAVLAAALGYELFGTHSDWQGMALLLGCVGGIIGAIAGAAREIATALHNKKNAQSESKN